MLILKGQPAGCPFLPLSLLKKFDILKENREREELLCRKIK